MREYTYQVEIIDNNGDVIAFTEVSDDYLETYRAYSPLVMTSGYTKRLLRIVCEDGRYVRTEVDEQEKR